MTTEWTYFAVLSVLAWAVVATVAATAWAERHGRAGGLTDPVRWIMFLVGVVGLSLVGLALRVEAIAEADGRIVEELSKPRRTNLEDFFSLVTATGDLVLTYSIGAGLAIAIFLSGRLRVTPWLLLLVTPLQYAIQLGLSNHVFRDLTIADVAPDVVSGGAGSNPSGGVARLLIIFLLADRIRRTSPPSRGSRLVIAGAVITYVEIITRLYLGRHLVSDIFGGLFLALAVTIALGAVVELLEPVERRLDEWTRRRAAS